MLEWPSGLVSALRTIVKNRRLSCVQQERVDVLQQLVIVNEKNSSRIRLDMRGIIDQVSEIILAGSETTAVATLCIMELAHNPEVKKKLLSTLTLVSLANQEKNERVFGGSELRTDNTFRYLDACIKETLRLHPISNEFGRHTRSDQSVDMMGYLIPSRTIVSASYRSLQRTKLTGPIPEGSGQRGG
jgi:cytochrome P450